MEEREKKKKSQSTKIKIIFISIKLSKFICKKIHISSKSSLYPSWNSN